MILSTPLITRNPINLPSKTIKQTLNGRVGDEVDCIVEMVAPYARTWYSCRRCIGGPKPLTNLPR
jgi:hypothetical protein